MIYFKDTPQTLEEQLFKLSMDYEAKTDDEVFFYVNGIHEIENMISQGVDTLEDFVVLFIIKEI